MKTRRLDVEECEVCKAPDPAGWQWVENSGPRRGTTYTVCRTCWDTGATSLAEYPGNYDTGTTKTIEVMCNIEQRRRLDCGYYDRNGSDDDSR